MFSHEFPIDRLLLLLNNVCWLVRLAAMLFDLFVLLGLYSVMLFVLLFVVCCLLLVGWCV